MAYFACIQPCTQDMGRLPLTNPNGISKGSTPIEINAPTGRMSPSRARRSTCCLYCVIVRPPVLSNVKHGDVLVKVGASEELSDLMTANNSSRRGGGDKCQNSGHACRQAQYRALKAVLLILAVIYFLPYSSASRPPDQL